MSNKKAKGKSILAEILSVGWKETLKRWFWVPILMAVEGLLKTYLPPFIFNLILFFDKPQRAFPSSSTGTATESESIFWLYWGLVLLLFVIAEIAFAFTTIWLENRHNHYKKCNMLKFWVLVVESSIFFLAALIGAWRYKGETVDFWWAFGLTVAIFVVVTIGLHLLKKLRIVPKLLDGFMYSKEDKPKKGLYLKNNVGSNTKRSQHFETNLSVSDKESIPLQ